MRLNNVSGIGNGLIMCGVLLIMGCVANQNDRDSRLVYENPECPAGQMLACEASGTGRLSDGRFGRRGNQNRQCRCEAESSMTEINTGGSLITQ